MKKYLIFFFVLFLVSASSKAQTQAETIAGRVADKMKDSLQLNTVQRNQLYQVNMDLANGKHLVRQTYQQADSVRIYMQRVENTRDSLYKTVLSDPQFLQYKQRKMFFLNVD